MNIYKILEALKGVEESVMSEIDQYYHEWINSEYAPMDDDAGDDKILMQKAAAFLRGQVNPAHIETYAQEMVRAYDGELNEADYPFAGQSRGQKTGDQVRGTEAFTTGGKEHPAKGRLVGASESVEMECGDSMSPLEKKLRARWAQTKKGLAEYGMTTGGTATGDAGTANPADQAKQVAQVQQNVNKLKSAGANIPNVGQAVQSVMKDPTQPASQLDKNISSGLGQEIDQVLTKGDPGTVNQLASLIRKVKQGQ